MGCLVLLALVAAVVGVSAWEYAQASEVGGPCRANKDCRGLSSFCLVAGGTRSFGGATEYLDEGTGVCSLSCRDDADCPAPLRCGTVSQYVVGRGNVVDGPPETVRACR